MNTSLVVSLGEILQLALDPWTTSKSYPVQEFERGVPSRDWTPCHVGARDTKKRRFCAVCVICGLGRLQNRAEKAAAGIVDVACYSCGCGGTNLLRLCASCATRLLDCWACLMPPRTVLAVLQEVASDERKVESLAVMTAPRQTDEAETGPVSRCLVEALRIEVCLTLLMR